MKVELNGLEIRSAFSFHNAIKTALDFPYYYGENLAALWDVLTTDIEGPILLVWNNSEYSRKKMPEEFDQIVGVLRRVEQWDKDMNHAEKFELKLL